MKITTVLTVIWFLLFSVLRPDPSNRQTNGISTPEHLTGRFQVSGAALQELWLVYTLFCLHGHHPLHWCPQLYSLSFFFLPLFHNIVHKSLLYLDNVLFWLHRVFCFISATAHICFVHLFLFYCSQDGSNTRHGSNLELVPVFYWHEFRWTF